MQIQDLVKGGQLLRQKVASVAEWIRASKASYLWLGFSNKAFGFLMLKYAFSHIVETFFLIFGITSTPKADKNRITYCTSINLKYSYILHLAA